MRAVCRPLSRLSFLIGTFAPPARCPRGAVLGKIGDAMADSARSVLLVEDDPLILESTASLLADEGCIVMRATSQAEATACLEQGPIPDCLVTDIMLNGQDEGLDLARTVASRWPEIRLILVSGAHRASRDEYPQKALFFTKPYANGALSAMINTPDW